MSKDVGEPMPDAAFRRTELKGSTIEASYAGALSFFRRKYSRDLDGVDVAVTGGRIAAIQPDILASSAREVTASTCCSQARSGAAPSCSTRASSMQAAK